MLPIERGRRVVLSRPNTNQHGTLTLSDRRPVQEFKRLSGKPVGIRSVTRAWLTFGIAVDEELCVGN